MLNIARETADFISYLKNVKNRSENTLQAYKADLEQFQSIMQDKAESLNDITANAINKHFTESLSNVSASSKARKISTLKSFFKFLFVNDYIDNNIYDKLEKPSIPKVVKQPIPNEAVRELMTCVKNDSTTADGNIDWFRNITLFTLVFNTGIRREEICNIKLADVNLKEKSLLINGKGNKQRVVYFNQETKILLSEYMASHRKLMKPSETSQYLFVTTRAEQMNKATVNKIMNKYINLAGLQGNGYTPHAIRRTVATKMYEQTGDIYAVQGVLGHANIATTQIYAKQNEDRKRNLANVVSF